MEEFHSDPSFPFGARGDGQLVVPSGQSYMTWENIATGSGWHGPVYVHVLDRPFRLYQLSEFSVVGELLQSSSTMGKTYVALYDENMRRVMMVLIGDSWVGSTKGYFNLYYYPQDSASAYRSSGYIYTSFRKTGKLWWGEYDGSPQGAIYGSIDGSGSSYPIAECDNASRVIKYVAILGYRYYSYNLVEMRIHDINVVADLRRHNPIDPNQEQLDELEGGATGNPRTKNAIEGYGTLGAAAVTPSWTGPWPLLHLVCNYVYSVITLVFHVTVDLLDTVEVIDFYMGIAEGVAIPLTEIREASNQALALINEITAQEEEKFWAFTMAVTWGALKIVSLGMKAALWLEALFFALLATWWFSFMMTLAYAVDCILSGTWTQLASALALAGLFVTYLFGGIHSWLSGGSQAWSEFRNVFHPEALHGALNWPEGYEECFKLRTSFYMTMAQFAALAVVVITIVAIWFGWLS